MDPTDITGTISDAGGGGSLWTPSDQNNYDANSAAALGALWDSGAIPPIPPYQPIPVMNPSAPNSTQGETYGTYGNGQPLTPLQSYQQGLGGLQVASEFPTGNTANETPIEDSFGGGTSSPSSGSGGGIAGALTSLFGSDPLGVGAASDKLAGAINASTAATGMIPSQSSLFLIAGLIVAALVVARA